MAEKQLERLKLYQTLLIVKVQCICSAQETALTENLCLFVRFPLTFLRLAV